MKIAVAADGRSGIAMAIADSLMRRGHDVLAHGALAEHEREDWAWAAEAAARDVAHGRAEQAVVCCWTGTGAAIAANKVTGVRAALCADGPTAAGARRWNDANVLAFGLRLTTGELASEMIAAFLSTPFDPDESRLLARLEPGRGPAASPGAPAAGRAPESPPAAHSSPAPP
jgi:ribose 5-phosphate isomerase B